LELLNRHAFRYVYSCEDSLSKVVLIKLLPGTPRRLDVSRANQFQHIHRDYSLDNGDNGSRADNPSSSQ
jgi:hypothetical protein